VPPRPIPEFGFKGFLISTRCGWDSRAPNITNLDTAERRAWEAGNKIESWCDSGQFVLHSPFRPLIFNFSFQISAFQLFS
jgi:hypothetical protein